MLPPYLKAEWPINSRLTSDKLVPSFVERLTCHCPKLKKKKSAFWRLEASIMQEKARMTASDWLLTDQMHSTRPPGNSSLRPLG